jgi:hypothetical protein
MSSRLLGCAALIVLTCAAYSNSFSAGFPFDNKQLILQDARVHQASGANVDLILQHSYWWPYGESGLYRPVTTLSYLFNYAVLGNGDRPAGYHVFNLTVHVINVLLVYALMVQLSGPAKAGHYLREPVPVVSGFSRTFVALTTAAVWAVHPLSTEAVTNIVGRADLLAALSVLGALLIYLRGRRASGSTRVGLFAGVMALSTLGVFAKESAVVILPVIALHEIVWWNRRQSVRALVWASVALAPPLLLMWSQRVAVLGSSPAVEFAFVDNPIVAAGFWRGRLTAIGVMGRHLALLVWPATLSNDYSYPQIPLVSGTAGEWALCLLAAAVAVTVLLLWRVQKDPPYIRPVERESFRVASFFAAFAFITFLPASNLLFPLGTIMAERLMYLPSIGIVALFAIGLSAAVQARLTYQTYLACLIVAIAVGGLSYRTWLRNRVWKDDVTLWMAAVQAAPASAKAHRALAEALYDADPAHANLERVIAEAEQSVTLLSALPDRWNSYQTFRQAGAYYLDKAGPDASRRALPLLQRNLAIIGAASARQPGASVAPEADANRLLAACYLGVDDPGRALDAAARARELGPLHPLAYRLAADALLGLRRADDAAVALMVGSIVTGDPGLGQAVTGLYRSGFDREGCAVVSTPQGPALNPSCPIVRRHLCLASAEAADVNTRLGRLDRAASARAFAAGEAGCR